MGEEGAARMSHKKMSAGNGVRGRRRGGDTEKVKAEDTPGKGTFRVSLIEQNVCS